MSRSSAVHHHHMIWNRDSRNIDSDRSNKKVCCLLIAVFWIFERVIPQTNLKAEVSDTPGRQARKKKVLL
jgi:hypothetical protein